MGVKCPAPGLVHKDIMTTQASVGILLGELLPQGVLSPIHGHFLGPCPTYLSTLVLPLWVQGSPEGRDSNYPLSIYGASTTTPSTW